MKHYYIYAAIQGVLVGAGCVNIFGTFGFIGGVIMLIWGVKSAYDMVGYKTTEGKKLIGYMR